MYRLRFSIVFSLSLPAVAFTTPSGVAPGEVLLRLRAHAAKRVQADTRDYLERLGALSGPEPLFETHRQRSSKRAVPEHLLRWHRVFIDPQEDPEDWARRAQLSEGIEWAQANYLRRHAEVKGDSLRGQQWGLQAVGWRPDVEAEPVVVAVIDSGVDYAHPDLAGQLWQNRAELEGKSGVDDDANGYVDDVIGWDFTDAPGLPGQGIIYSATLIQAMSRVMERTWRASLPLKWIML